MASRKGDRAYAHGSGRVRDRRKGLAEVKGKRARRVRDSWVSVSQFETVRGGWA